MPSPVVAHDLFYLSGGNPRGREFYVVRPKRHGDISPPASAESTRQVAWRKAKGSPYTPTPIVYGGYLYVCNDNGVLTVYNALTGEQIYQQRIGTTNSTFSASPIASGGRLYFSSEDGEVFVIKAGPSVRVAVGQPHGRTVDGDAGRIGRDDRDPRPAARLRGEVDTRAYASHPRRRKRQDEHERVHEHAGDDASSNLSSRRLVQGADHREGSQWHINNDGADQARRVRPP